MYSKQLKLIQFEICFIKYKLWLYTINNEMYTGIACNIMNALTYMRI